MFCRRTGCREYDETGVMTNDGHDFSHRIKTVYKLLRDNGKYHVMSAGKDDLYSNDKKVRRKDTVRPTYAKRFPSRLRQVPQV